MRERRGSQTPLLASRGGQGEGAPCAQVPTTSHASMTSLLPKPARISPGSEHRRRAQGKAAAPRRAAEVREEVRARMIRKVRVEEAMARKAAGTLEALASGLQSLPRYPCFP